MSNSVLVRFDVAAEGDDVGFAVCGQDVQPHSQVDAGGEDLGELLPTSALVDLRAEIVVETTVEDARRVRLLPDVNHISKRKVGQQGRASITVDLPESVILDRAAFGPDPRCVHPLRCFSTNPRNNGKNCPRCCSRRRGPLDV